MQHIFIDILRNSILITGLVVVMMMMIESLNIESRGLLFKGLRKTKFGQVIIGALLGSIPGCMGGFAAVSLYTHRLFSFGALIAMMIASSGDEAFVMLAMIPDQALAIFAGLFVLAVIVGILVDQINDRRHAKHCHKHDHADCIPASDCPDGYAIHTHHDVTDAYAIHPPDGKCCHTEPSSQSEATTSDPTHGGASGRRPVRGNRTYGWKRIAMFIGLAAFIAALATGNLGHDHGGHAGHGHEAHAGLHIEAHDGHEYGHNHSGHIHTEACEHSSHHETNIHEINATCGHDHGSIDSGNGTTEAVDNEFTIDLLSEDWMNVLFAGLSVIVLFVLLFASDHFVEEHLWNHIIKKHLLTIFAWTFGVLLVLGIGLQYIDIEHWISGNTALMIILATAIGIIPESGPHLIFVTLYAAGVVPLPVLIASSISQDGHSALPLLAESRRSFLQAKAINCLVALLAGFGLWLLM